MDRLSHEQEYDLLAEDPEAAQSGPRWWDDEDELRGEWQGRLICRR